MANDEPPYLTVGTDVSAKYKGAFCEAKIKKVNRVVKCKVNFKNNLGSFVLTHDLIKGSLRIGADVEAKHPEKNQFLDATINKMQDYSQYTVVFDDGDETTLRRTSLCLKSGRHFAESPTLDQFPLTNPEHFGTPVIGAGKYKRKRRSTMNSSIDYESSDDDSFPRKLKAIRGKEKDPDLGKVVAVDYGDRRKKDSWYPGLIVPLGAQSNIKISKEEHLIRSFKDGKYYQVPKRDTREFIKDKVPKTDNNALKIAVDKAILYIEKDELPTHWDKALFMGLELPSADEDSQDSDTDTSDDEPSEDKDRFVAQLYKFMDERGTPINKAPAVSNRDLNLYKLFKLMHKLGGFNKVTNQNKWKVVYSKMGLPANNPNGPNQIKSAYKRYLQSFEDFYRKLGCTMVNNSRSMRGRHRSDRNFILTRTRDRDTSSPEGRNSKDSKDKASAEKKTEEKPVPEKKEIKKEEPPKVEEKIKSPEKKKTEKKNSDEKDDKKKKEERPRLVRSLSLIKEKKESPKEDEKKDGKPEKARTREDARKEKTESPEKKGTRSSIKIEQEKKEEEHVVKEKPGPKDKKDPTPKGREKKEEKSIKEIKEEKPKEKKEEKPVKDNKLIKGKKTDEKLLKEKIEDSPKEKKDEPLKPVREKRDTSKEPKDDKSKCRKEDIKIEEKASPKKKPERVLKDVKKEEKIIVRPRRENKSPLPEIKKPESVKIKEEKPKVDVDIKKEELVAKDKPGPKLREKRDEIHLSGDEEIAAEADIDEKDQTSQDEFEKREGPGPRLNNNDEPPNRGRKKSLKSGDKDEKECEEDMTESDDEAFSSEQDKELRNFEIEVGDRVRVKYGRGRLKKVYDAKVLKVQTDGTEKRYFVHYNGWNNRYDEWVRRNFIVSLVNTTKQKGENSNKCPYLGSKKIDKGRPPGPIMSSKPARKNSTSSTNSSISVSRATRSDKKMLQSSLLSGSTGPKKKRTRKKSGLTGLTDTSQDSDSDLDDADDEGGDDEVGDADIEDNANVPNDSSFKEELFSDDEEKEKLEDVKRDDITELEKAISVEESAEDLKGSLFSLEKKNPSKIESQLKGEVSVVIENPKIIKETLVKEALKKEVSSADTKSEDKKIDSAEIPKFLPVKTDDKLGKTAQDKTPEVKNIHITEASITPVENKTLIKTAKTISSVAASPEQNPEKSIFQLTLKPLPATVEQKEEVKSSFIQSLPAPAEGRKALSFAGLQGLIQISSFDKNLNRTAPKESPSKTELPKTTVSVQVPKIELKPDCAPKNLTSSLFRTDKNIPIFRSSVVLTPAKLADTNKLSEKPSPKSNQEVISFMKENEEKDAKKDLKPTNSPIKSSSVEKPEQKTEEVKIDKAAVSVEKKVESTSFKHSILSPTKFSTEKIESDEQKQHEKVKDSFDLLVESSKTADQKKHEAIENIFSLSFPTFSTKEKPSTDKSFGKGLAASAENLCMKSKLSETFDLSKTIPGIIERLKKDVVNDLKVTDSPPPQREELNFNFLKSCQDLSKSLSRSESSNSLRICEDTSDTNESNTDSKDFTSAEKVSQPSLVTSNAVSDNAVSYPNENIKNEHLDELINKNLSSDSTPSTTKFADKKDDSQNSFKTSVITVATTKATTDLPMTALEVSKDSKNSVSPECSTVPENDKVETKVEPSPVKPVKEETNINLDAEMKESKSNPVNFTTEIPVDVKKDTEAENLEKVEEPTIPTTTKSEKDSLFDDLLKIKSTNQSSVIMWNPEMKISVSKSSEDSKDKEVKAESLLEKEKGQLLCRDTEICNSFNIENKLSDKTEDDLDSSIPNDIKSDPEDVDNHGDDSNFSSSKKELKKKKFKKFKKFNFDGEDVKGKDGKSKSKKRMRLENDDSERSRDPDQKSKSKKFKKNKNKKRMAKLENLDTDYRKGDVESDQRDITDKIKRKEKRKSEKKFFKSGMKDFESRLEIKKKKGKKNRDKFGGEKKDFLEKKVKKKKKLYIEDNQDTDSEKESLHKMMEKKKKKDRKKFKTKDSSSSDDGNDKYFKNQSKIHNLPSCSIMRQDSKSDDPDMSFLLCEEKVPASPGLGIGNNNDDTSSSSSIDEGIINRPMDILPLPNVCPLLDNIESSDVLKNRIGTRAVLDNTPPTTPSSTESLLSSSPSHERDSFSMNYPESTQSGRDSGEGESDLYHVNANRTISRGSDEYNAATTLAFAVCKTSVAVPKPKEEASSHSFLKRQKSEVEDHSPTKRKKKSKRVRRCSESGRSPRHKSSVPRMSKVESCCEDSSGASPAASSSPAYSNTSTMSFSRSPHRMSCPSEGFSRYNFYVPLHEKDPEKRIALLQEKMTALRKEYMALRAKVIAIDHKRRRARKKLREAGTANPNPSAQSEDGQSCS